MHEPDGLMSVGLERDLNTILNGNEMEDVRSHLEKKKERAIDEQVENNLKEIALPDLDEDQERQLREVLRSDITAKSVDGAEPPTTPAELRRKLTEEMDSESLVKKLDEAHREKREKLAVFLTPPQLERLDAYHAQQKRQALLAADMFGSMVGGNVGAKVEVKTSK